MNEQDFDVPGEEDVVEIVRYLQQHPNDPNAIDNLMKEYNCTRKSIMNIVMNGSAD